MATRRDKSARRPTKRQVKKGKPKKAVKARPRAKVPKKVTVQSKKTRTPKKHVQKRKKKVAKKVVKQKLSRQKSVGKVKVKKSFIKLRKTALKQKKLPLPMHPKRKGKTALRGVNGKERSITLNLPWDNVHEAWLESSVFRSFESLAIHFKKPTMYVRFTFTLTRVMTMLMAGSPKIIRATSNKVKAWFFSSGLAYTQENMRHQFEKSIDTLNQTIVRARQDNQDPEFFLEYVTCIAYEVN